MVYWYNNMSLYTQKNLTRLLQILNDYVISKNWLKSWTNNFQTKYNHFILFTTGASYSKSNYQIYIYTQAKNVFKIDIYNYLSISFNTPATER